MSANHSDKAIGVILGAAVGDALGWPQEDRSNIVGGKGARDVEPRPQFRRWERNAGTRFARYVEPVAAGEYSDDTQLILAVARSCLRGPGWLQWFERVELPQWPLYQRGGGGSVLRAANSWARGKPPWSVATKQDQNIAAKYFAAGANGVAMRIAPHAIVTTTQGVDEMLRRVLLDGISTHGHPRALLGACLHAMALRFALSLESTLEYGALLNFLREEQIWRDPEIFADVISSDWLESYGAVVHGGNEYNPAHAWRETVKEVDLKLQTAVEGLKRGALANDNETLQEIGCFDRHGGSGIVAAVAALYVSARTASRPMSGLLRTGFLRNADTDTIASMTGSILGAIHGPQWLNGLGPSVQDSEHITQTARALSSAKSGLSSDRQPLPRSVTEKALSDWSDRLSASAEAAELPDGRGFEISEILRLPTNTKNFVTRIVGRAADGQTIILDEITKSSTEAFRRGNPVEPLQPPKASMPTTRATTQIRGIELAGQDLEASHRFYRDVLRLSCTLANDRLVLSDSLTISRGRVQQMAPADCVLTLTVGDLTKTAAALKQIRGLKFSWTPGSDAISLADPDGYQIRIVEIDVDKRQSDNPDAEDAPWRITHRRGMTYELSNVTATPKFHVVVSGEGVLRDTTAPRIDGMSGIGFMGLDAFGVGDRVDVTWHLRDDRSDEMRRWSGNKPHPNT